MKKTTVDTMVDRFLGWKLPKDFAPDCGISFDGRKDDEWNENKSWPIGTNLFNAEQARSMVIAILGGTDLELIERAVAAEQKRCATLCEQLADHYGQDGGHVADHCALQIMSIPTEVKDGA